MIVASQPYTHQAGHWTYGVWHCMPPRGTSRLHGRYPQTYLKRVLALFPDCHTILQCPSGVVTSPGVTVDLSTGQGQCPCVQADATALPFRDKTFDLYIADPPYTSQDAEKYGTPVFSVHRAMQEAYRVLRRGGYYALLHFSYPAYGKSRWELVGLIGVLMGFQSRIRVLSIFQKQ